MYSCTHIVTAILKLQMGGGTNVLTTTNVISQTWWPVEVLNG